jgi:hypothetical protein
MSSVEEVPTTSEAPATSESPTTSEVPGPSEAPGTSEEPVGGEVPVVEVGPPVALVLAGGEVAVARAESDENGLPSAPESAGRGALRWSPAEDGRAARAVVALHAEDAVPEVGSVVVMRAEDGSVDELTIRSRHVVDGGTAADLASGRGESTRLVLLVAPPDTGEIVVLIAE